MSVIIETNYQSNNLSATICMGDYGLMNRLKLLYFLIVGRTVTFSGNAVRHVSARDAKVIP